MADYPRSCIYKGFIRHRRFFPVSHEFRYFTKMIFLDLSTIEKQLQLFPIFHTRWLSLGWFRRKDYHGNEDVPLEQHIRDFVKNETNLKVDGKIFLLTHLRYWGLIMNPISIFYCYNENQQLLATVFQVTNTPWREKILYANKVKQSDKKFRFQFLSLIHI